MLRKQLLDFVKPLEEKGYVIETHESMKYISIHESKTGEFMTQSFAEIEIVKWDFLYPRIDKYFEIRGEENEDI